MSDNRRLKLLSAHLSSHFQSSPTDDSLLKFLERTPSLNSKALFDCYFADMALGIQMYRKAMVASPKFDHLEEMEMTTEQIRERCIKQVKELCLVKTLSVEADLKEPIESGTIIYSAAEYDLALATRLVVSHGLYGDTLQTLGTQKHKIFLERIYKLKDIGSISITELGHGSNLSMLETIANYDHANREFIINSPTATSAKWWIGAVSKSANMTALFARLIVDSTDKGVHVFAVPIRNYETHEALPGVIIGDCGKKNGLNGVDNGYLLFKNYRVSYDSLLDKMSSINTEGKFKSSIKNNDKRLGTMLGGLLRGRLGTISGSEMNLRQALTIALRYAAVRRQFSSTSDEEIRLLDYQSHQYRLIPYLAKCVALRACVNKLWNSFKSVREKLLEDPECNELQEYHTILSALKGIAGKYSITGIQESRESTGGNGFSSYSSFNRLRNNQDMHLTWEGDSTVLAQQTGKYILKQIQRIYKGQKITNPTLQYLCIDPDLIRNYRAAFKTKEELLNENLLTELLEFRVNYCLQQSINRIQANASKYANITEA